MFLVNSLKSIIDEQRASYPLLSRPARGQGELGVTRLAGGAFGASRLAAGVVGGYQAGRENG